MYLRHAMVELSAENRRSLDAPELCALGIDDTEVAYQVSEFYEPSAELGLRHDDPALAIDWPRPVAAISPMDAAWPFHSIARVSGPS